MPFRCFGPRNCTQIENCRIEIFRAKSCPIDEDEMNSGRSTPNGIYAGSVGSDNVFRDPAEQAAWYKKPKWARWNPEEPGDINEDQFYTALSPQPSIAGGSAVVPVKGATSITPGSRVTPTRNISTPLACPKSNPL